MLFAFLIGLARIAAGIHFPIDVLAGFIIGILTAYLVDYLYLKLPK
jgi:undecaprenyl-diphosphatase